MGGGPRGPAFEKPEPTWSDVFVSYSREHGELVELLVKVLLIGNRHVYLDVFNILPGDRWPDELMAAVRRSHKVIVIWCRHAAQSEWVKKETELASLHKKIIVPVLLDDTPLPPHLAERQWINLQGKITHEESQGSALQSSRDNGNGDIKNNASTDASYGLFGGGTQMPRIPYKEQLKLAEEVIRHILILDEKAAILSHQARFPAE
jgi:hypothetical protein